MSVFEYMPGVPAAGHLSRGYWHPGRIDGCPRCGAPPVQDGRRPVHRAPLTLEQAVAIGTGLPVHRHRDGRHVASPSCQRDGHDGCVREVARITWQAGQPLFVCHCTCHPSCGRCRAMRSA